VVGVLWLLFSVGFGLALLEYLMEGAGLQLLGWNLCTGTIVVGVIHVIGLAIAAVVCLCVGIWFCSNAVASIGDKKAAEK